MAKKKSDQEKRETRRLAKARYRTRKAEKGLKQFSIWLPEKLLKKAQEAGDVDAILFGKRLDLENSVTLARDEDGEWGVLVMEEEE